MDPIAFSLHIQDLENKCNLPQGFMHSLPNENDWSFIIKTYAIFEALLSELIAKISVKPELRSFFLKLDMCSNPIGKLALLKKLSLLEEPECKFIRALSDLRNIYAHNIKKISASIEDTIVSFPSDKQKKIVQDLSFSLHKKDDFEKNKKQCIWVASVMLLCQINERTYKKTL
ncbi:MAG: hypothetical protein KJ887_00865 [Candidatus Omnitrophica bacterium]|nr:hypothetical protein [Candidatus Omnitrophota bacterium]MBU1048115.1 hypothetical protein [Candidatus Omnitrophota bacterium]MBU1631252.1 hypothetical protein [Candidatus Omnitrophota bacterium]MBU1889205.1 hypothetical protein [Candidatus Omnitrophota bacterium]